jgi:hypothetical protein
MTFTSDKQCGDCECFLRIDEVHREYCDDCQGNHCVNCDVKLEEGDEFYCADCVTRVPYEESDDVDEVQEWHDFDPDC